MRASRGIFKGRRILEESSVDLMATDHEGYLYTTKGKTRVRRAEGMGYTVWVILQPDLAFLPISEGSSGWGGSFGTLSWSEPRRDLAVVIMSHGSVEGFSAEIAEIINAAIISR
jgi:CubicO group peptidase (beta-lactamase class C family)